MHAKRKLHTRLLSSPRLHIRQLRTRRSSRHHQIPNIDLHRLVILIQRRRAHLDHALLGPRPGWAHLEHLDREMQLVARPDRLRPAELVEPGTDDPGCRLKLALDEQPHRERSRVPAARREAAEERIARRLLVEMERLRIELGGKALDPLGIDAQAS